MATSGASQSLNGRPLFYREIFLVCTDAGTTTNNNPRRPKGKEMILRERLKGEEEVRVRFQVEETPSSLGDACGIPIFLREKLDSDHPEGARLWIVIVKSGVIRAPIQSSPHGVR